MVQGVDTGVNSTDRFLSSLEFINKNSLVNTKTGFDAKEDYSVCYGDPGFPSDVDCIRVPQRITFTVARTSDDLDLDIVSESEVLDLKYVTGSMAEGLAYISNLANMLRKGGWWGLVCVELHPGPAHKAPKKVQKKEKSKSSSSGGKSLGSKIGGGIGGFLGDLAQKAIMTITGMGDYKVQTNTLFDGTVTSSSPPQFLTKGGSGTTRVLHREYLADIISPGQAFNLQSFILNPEAVGTFPWLSNIANNYEQFRFHGLVFEFKSNSATAVASTNTALGAVILATQYNALEPPFVSKLQMDQYEFAVSTNPAVSAIHPVECARPLGAPDFLYTDPGAAGLGSDPRFSRLGNFTVATVGQQSTSNIGELWVSYDVEFQKPRLDGGTVSTAQDYNWLMRGAIGVFTLDTTDLFSQILGTSIFIGNTADLNITMGTKANGNANTIIFAPGIVGKFMITMIYGTTSAVVKTANNQPIFTYDISTFTGPQPWVYSPTIFTNPAAPFAAPINFSCSPYATGAGINGLVERYVVSIQSSLNPTKLLLTCTFPTAPGATTSYIGCQISPYWFTNT